jgi:hypothetical protein
MATDDGAKQGAAQRPRCTACAHYYITHDLSFPYGCHALRFKSARQPIVEVIEASGQPCLYFQPKPRSPAR